MVAAVTGTCIFGDAATLYKYRFQSFIWRYFYCAFLGSSLEIIDSEMCSPGWGNLVAKKKKQKQINNPASNNRGILIAAAFHFVAAVENTCH